MSTRRFLWSVVLALGLCGCGDSTGIAPGGPAFVAATLDGKAWVADTSLAIFYDSDLVLGGVRQVSATRTESFTLILHDVHAPVAAQLTDTAGEAFAVFTEAQDTGGIFLASLNYWTSAQHPGRVLISAINTSDSLVTGTFAFEAAPEAAPGSVRRLSGRFRIPYIHQQVYTPDGSRDGGGLLAAVAGAY